MRNYRTQVVIAGAGPVGSVAAYYLASHGINVILLEAGHDCAMDLRASTFHPPTLELLDDIDITSKLITLGLKAPVYHFRERATGETIDFDLSEIADATKYPFRIQCEQYHLSRMLSQAVSNELDNPVFFGHRLIGVDQDTEGVDVLVEMTHELATIRADYLIGADGANSIVRKWLGVEFDGFTYPEKFLCLTTEEPLEDYLENLCYVNYVSDPEEWMVLLRVPSLWRILVPTHADQTDEYLLSDEKRNTVFENLIGKSEGVMAEHQTLYRVHQRVAKSFRDRRIALIGDAAHLNNPIGGFGMNTGIHDAYNLCERLVRIYKNGVDADSELSKFEIQRRRISHDFIQAQTKKNLAYLRQDNKSEHELRKKQLEDIREDPELRRQYLLRQSMIECLQREKEIA